MIITREARLGAAGRWRPQTMNRGNRMTSTMDRIVRAGLVASLCLSAPVANALAQPPQPPQHDDDHGMAPSVPDRYNEPIPIFKVGLGPFKRAISSTNADAQAYFNQA